MTHVIGLSSIHRRLKHVLGLIERGQDIEVHYRGRALFKLVSMKEPDGPEALIKKKVAAMLSRDIS